MGFCCDEGVKRNLGRVGAAEGPQALRKALANLPLHFQEHEFIYDIGDIVCHDQDLEKAQHALRELVANLLTKNYKPIIIGGGHEIAWGHYQGIDKVHADQTIGIINFDAHFDLRNNPEPDKGSSGTPFRQIAEYRQAHDLDFDYLCLGIQQTGNTRSLFRKAKELNVNYVLAEDIHQKRADCESIIQKCLNKHDLIYLTICLDVFNNNVAPGVSAPQPLGLTPLQVIPLLKQIVQSNKVISFDIAELNPKYDQDDRTAQLAALLVSEYIHAYF